MDDRGSNVVCSGLLGVQEMGNGASADESPNAIRVQATPTPRDNRTQNGGPPDRARRKGGGFQEVEMQHASQNNTPRQSNTPRQNANRPGQSSEGRGQRQSQPGGSTQRQGQAPGGSTPRQHGQGNQRGVRPTFFNFMLLSRRSL